MWLSWGRRFPNWREPVPRPTKYHLSSDLSKLQGKPGLGKKKTRKAPSANLISEPRFLHMLYVGNLSTLCSIHWEKCSLLTKIIGRSLTGSIIDRVSWFINTKVALNLLRFIKVFLRTCRSWPARRKSVGLVFVNAGCCLHFSNCEISISWNICFTISKHNYEKPAMVLASDKKPSCLRMPKNKSSLCQ